MELLKQPPTGKGPAEMFAGDVWFDVTYRGEEPSRARANIVYPGPDGAPENTWLEHVTDAEYNGPRVSTRQ
jgi:hypothetical protein